MHRICASAVVGLLGHVLTPAPAPAQPDLTKTLPIFTDDFRAGINRFDGRSGLWSTLPRRGQLMTNAAEAVFVDQGVLGDAVDAILPPVHAITDQGLALRTVLLPDAAKPDLARYMQATGQGGQAAQIRYATGQITTSHTWSQTYGYFEIEARIPRGQGRWPAFWLTSAGPGWPPEIDILEAYGAGLDQPTKKDNQFNTAVLFDALDADLNPTHPVDIENGFAITPGGRRATVKARGELQVHTFGLRHDAERQLGARIYDDFHVYAALWTPDTITFYFGKDRASLTEIYRVPTPPDVNDPMFIIANDQFTARGGILPARPAELDRVLSPQNAFEIRRITVHALTPTTELRMADGMNAFDPRDSLIFDTAGDDHIMPGPGFDIIHLTGGADRVYLTRDRANKILIGFGPDDTLVLEGYPFVDSADALSRLTQVGPDVWLPSGADPVWPHTVIFRDTVVAALSAAQFDLRWPMALDVWRAAAARAGKPEVDTDGDGIMRADRPSVWMTDQGAPVQMIGSPGPDRFHVAHPKTTVVETAAGGLDTLVTWVSMDVPAHIERGIARGKDLNLQGHDTASRLEADGDRIILAGGRGDDLFVIRPAATTTTIRIGTGDGHDRLRGFSDGDRLALSPALQATRAAWTLADAPDGVLVTFGPDQTLLIEGHASAAMRRLLAME